MSLVAPNLDDRDFNQLLEAAVARIRASASEWTDLKVGDPGIVLLEAFAFLTDVLLYRLNRVPEKAYVEFLRLIGVRLQPPTAAAATIRFRRRQDLGQRLELRRGLRVTVARATGGGEAPVFATAVDAAFAPGVEEVDVPAYHCELVDAELAGHGMGLPGLTVHAQRPPITDASRDGMDLVVGVEATETELAGRAPAREYGGKQYRIWREVQTFAEAGADRFCYVSDRMTGRISFAPEVRFPDGSTRPEAARHLGEVPPAGREIRLWYRRGGGSAGNVVAGTLTVLKDPIPGVSAENLEAAVGGRDAETMDNALRRGPLELHSLERTVTAQDYELVALRSGAVARARAFTQAAVWKHARPGTVEVLIVPAASESERSEGLVTAEILAQRETRAAVDAIRRELDRRKPLGTDVIVSWAKCKTVEVHARVVAHREEDAADLKARVLRRLRRAITPLPAGAGDRGWGFGQALRASHVYDILLSDPGVSYADDVRFVVQDVPGEDVKALCGDAFQPNTWYAGGRDLVLRTLNDGEGWEPLVRLTGETPTILRAHHSRAGALALVTHITGASGSRVHVSFDCGESWTAIADTAFGIRDASWVRREDRDLLLLATDRGFYELAPASGSVPVQSTVDPADPDRGFYAVSVTRGVRGEVFVAAAAQKEGGVWLSRSGGLPGSFKHVGLKGQDIRVLAFETAGARTFLWGGRAAAGGEEGTGCSSLELRAIEESADEWTPRGSNWVGGSCRGLAFAGSRAFAATHRRGVLTLDTTRSDAAWEPTPTTAGLPLRDPGPFLPVDAVATTPQSTFVMAAGASGVYRRAVAEAGTSPSRSASSVTR